MPAYQLCFKPLTPADFPLAEAFKRRTARDNLGSDARFTDWFPSKRPYALFAERLLAFDPAAIALLLVDGVPVGDVELQIREGGGYVSNYYLEPEWRGRGLGRALDEYAMAFFRRYGQTFARLRTNPANNAVRGFYAKLGWQEDSPCPADSPEAGMIFLRKAVPIAQRGGTGRGYKERLTGFGGSV